MSQWPMVPLGEVIRHRKEFIQIDDFSQYKRCRVQLHARGIVLRDQVPGTEIKTKKQQVCQASEFLVAEIDAKHGGYGIVPDDLDGAIVSSHYFLFEIDETRLDRHFLGYFIRTPAFFDQVSAQGSTNYAAIRPGHVLQYTVPLPPLSEQQRIVEWLDAVATRVEEAKRLRAESLDVRDAMIAAHTLQIFEGLAKRYPERKLGDFEPHVTSGPRNWGQRTAHLGDRFYRAQDVFSDGSIATSGKVFIETPNTAQGAGAKLRPGDLMIVITGATVGRVAVYPPNIEPGYVSQHVAICRIAPTELAPRFALHGLLSPYGQIQLLGQRYGQGKPGLNLTNIRNLRLPIPPIAVQERVAEYLDQVKDRIGDLKSSQAESEKEIEAVVPVLLNQAFNGKPREERI